MPFWIVLLLMMVLQMAPLFLPFDLPLYFVPAAMLVLAVLFAGFGLVKQWQGQGQIKAGKGALSNAVALLAVAVVSFVYQYQHGPTRVAKITAEENYSRAELEDRIVDSLFPDYRGAASPAALPFNQVESEIENRQCPRLKQVVNLLKLLRDDSVNETHSGRTVYPSGTYTVHLFNSDRFNEKVEANQWWLLKDADYFDWQQRGFLDVPPGVKNGFASKKPAYLWVKGKYRDLLKFEIEKCGQPKAEKAEASGPK